MKLKSTFLEVLKPLILSVLIVAFVVPGALAQSSQSPYQTIQASDLDEDDQFGRQFDFYENNAIFTAPGNSSNNGAYYIFERATDEWEQVSRVLGSSSRQYTKAVVISERYAAVSYESSTGSPGVIIRDKQTGWSSSTTIEFSSVDYVEVLAIDDNKIAIQTYDETADVYELEVYEATEGGDWNELQTITSLDSDLEDDFAEKATIYGDILVISTVDNAFNDRIDIYEFSSGSFTHSQTIFPPTEAGNTSDFGTSVSVYNDVLAIGSIRVDVDDNVDVGAVFIYLFNDSEDEWEFNEMITEDLTEDFFGSHVDVHGDYLAVARNRNGSVKGEAYLYERQSDDTYDLTKILNGVSSQNGDNIGEFDIATWNGEVLVGAPNHTIVLDDDAGEAYFFVANSDVDNFNPTISTWTVDGSPTSTATEVSYTIIFNEDILGADVEDFKVRTLTGDATAASLSLTQNDFDDYTLDVEDISGQGFFDIVFDDADRDIEDVAGNNAEAIVISEVHQVELEDTDFLAIDEVELSDRILSPFGANTARFGASVYAEDGVILVGAPSESSLTGSIVQVEKSSGSYDDVEDYSVFGGSEGDLFGTRVVLNNGLVVGSARGVDGSFNSEGEVFVFEEGATSSSQEITVSATEDNQEFGNILASYNTTLVIGTDNIFADRVAYLYERDVDDDFIFDESLTPRFQYIDIAVGQDHLIFGCSGADTVETNAGVAIIYERDGDDWVETAVLTAPSFQNSMNFGRAVAIDDGTLVITATGDDLAEGAGSAYVYALNSSDEWELQSILIPEEGEDSDSFGRSVDIDGDFIVIGADNTDTDGFSNSGAAYVFRRFEDKWFQVALLTSDSPASSDGFGEAVAIDDRVVVVGEPDDDEGGASATGAIYVYEIEDLTITWIGGTSGVETDWETASNWSGGVAPSGTDFVKIPPTSNDPVIDSDEEVLDITIEAGASLTVNSGASLAIYGTATVNGDYTVKRKPIGNAGLSIVSAPISDADISDLAADYAYDFDGTSYGSAAGAMNPGQGYFIGYDATSPEISLTGTPNTGDVTASVTSGDYELVGNPYAAPISIADFLTNNSSVIAGTVYFWNDGGSNLSSERGGDYVTANAMGSVSSVEPDGVDDGVDGDQLTGAADIGVIPSMQGVFVEAIATGDVTFSQDMQEITSGANSDANYYRIVKTPKVKLTLSGANFYDELLVGFTEEATAGRDLIYDAKKLSSDDTKGFYSFIGTEKYAIQGVPIEGGVSVLLEARALPGEYDLKVALQDVPQAWEVYLIAQPSGEVYELADEETIKLNLSELSFFELAMRDVPLSVEDPDNSLIIYGNMQGLRLVYPANKGHENITIYTLNGSEVFNEEVRFSGSEADIYPAIVPHQLYVISIRDQKVKFILNK